MTITRFERIVLRLANQMPTRYYLHDGPTDAPESVMKVQFQVRIFDNVERLHVELAQLGFTRCLPELKHHETWSIERTE